MEFLGVILIWVAFAFVWKFVASLTRAGWRSATGKGSFTGNFQASFAGMSAMEMRLRRERVDGEKHSYDVYRVEIKGLLPVEKATALSVAAAVFDVTATGKDGKPVFAPVTCFLDQFQEPDSHCFQDLGNFGVVQPGVGFADWITVATVIPETLTAPYSGRRKLGVYLTLFNTNNPPAIRHGFVDGAVLGTLTETFEYILNGTGYREADENRLRAEELTIQAAMSVAMADGTLADPEGLAIKNWIRLTLDLIPAENRVERRDRLNSVLRKTFDLARAGNLDLGAVLTEFAKIGDSSARAEAVELCLEVMSADGKADRNELEQVNRIAAKLAVDVKRFQDLKDKHLAALASTVTAASDYHSLLGIERNWDKDTVRMHLNRLYAQWNSRAESQDDPAKRAQAEQMLDHIAGARQALLG